METLVKAFIKEGCNYTHVFSAALSALFHEPDFGPAIHAVLSDQEPEKKLGRQIQACELNPVITNRLFLAMMNKVVLADRRLELWLTAFRHSVLKLLLSDGNDPFDDAVYTPFLCTLSHQCFLNEYIYFETEEEKQQVSQLIGIIESQISQNSVIRPAWIIVLSLYRPLINFGFISSFMNSGWEEPVSSLLIEQFMEPSIERSIRADIHQLTMISSDVSKTVRDQYEENPFPRWDSYPSVTGTIPLNSMITQLFPSIDRNTLPQWPHPDILVAGCGTGWIPVALSMQIKNAAITAIDLSLSSLAYAIRKSRKIGLDNIEYAQGDILKLRELNKQFDHINCFGVLHHMDIIQDGFSVLNDILRPGGTMLIGLYSKIARKGIYEARSYIAEKNYPPTPDGMRKCRQDIFNLDACSSIHELTQAIAFYSMSDFRDLLFHVQEHCLTIPELKQIISTLDLHFLGFEIHDPTIVQKYHSLYPDDPLMTSFDYWNEFENANPNTFMATYRFWVQKPANQ